MTTKSTHAFEQRVKQLDTALNGLARRLSNLETATEAMKSAAETLTASIERNAMKLP
jgi:exonuclease VII small subunit